MELKFQISIKDTLVEIKFTSIESFERAIPAFIENKNALLKAQNLIHKLILIQSAISKLLNQTKKTGVEVTYNTLLRKLFIVNLFFIPVAKVYIDIPP